MLNFANKNTGGACNILLDINMPILMDFKYLIFNKPKMMCKVIILTIHNE